MKIILFLIALGVSSLAWAQSLTLTEQQLNQELNRQLGKEFPFSLGSWLSAGIELKQLSIELGRQEADKARVQGQGILSMQQGQQRSQWDIEGNFSARPRYDSEQGALFLDEFTLLSYRLNQETSSPQAGMMLPLLLQGLAGYLSRYPVYTLDDKHPLQRQLKDRVLSLEIAPGELLLHGID